MIRTFDELRTGSKARLMALRKDAQKLANNPHRNMHVAANPTWRTVRYSALSGKFPAACPGFNGNRPILSAFSLQALPIRNFKWADDVSDSGINHAGWFTREDCSAKARGFVACLPHGRFLPGYYWSDNGEWVLFCSAADIETDAADCARSADHEAESFADDAREDDERFQAMSDAESEAQEKETDFLKAYALRHNPRFGGIDAAREALQALREAREDRAEKTKAYEGV